MIATTPEVKSEIAYYDLVPVSVNDKASTTRVDVMSKFVSVLVGRKVEVVYEPNKFLLHVRTTLPISNGEVSNGQIQLVRLQFSVDMPEANKAPGWGEYGATGYTLVSKGGTVRFARAILRHKNCHPWLQFSTETPVHQLPGQIAGQKIGPMLVNRPTDYYISDFWMTIAEIVSSVLITSPESASRVIDARVSKYIQQLELVKNKTASFVMGQELEIGVPDLIDCSPNLRSETRGTIVEAFQRFALSQGWSLSATSKSHPGSVVTKGLLDRPSKRTLLSHMLMPASTQRWCRAPREQRGIREAIELVEPSLPSVYLEDFKMPEMFLPYVTELNVLYMDTEHSVPSANLNDSEWNPIKDMNKDRLLLTPTGQHRIRSRARVEKTMSEEKFLSRKSKLEAMSGYSLDSEEFEQMDGLYVKTYRVSYDEEETRARHVKAVSFTGLKGVTEPIKAQYYWSHKQGLDKLSIVGEEDTHLTELISKKVIVPVDIVAAASGIYSKRADAMLHVGIPARMAWEDGTTRVIPDLTAREWVSSNRSEAVEKDGIFLNDSNDYVQDIMNELESRNQDKQGRVYVYYMTMDGPLLPVKDTSGQQAFVVGGRNIFWRTRHRDQIGAEVKTFGPNDPESEKNRGVRVDFHTAKLAHVSWQMGEMTRFRVNTHASAMHTLCEIIGFPDDSPISNTEDMDRFSDEMEY